MKSSIGCLDLYTIPERLIVIGAGFTALGLSQAFARPGNRITVQARNRLFVPRAPAIGEAIETVFKQ